VREQSETAQTGFPFEPRCEVVGHADHLERRAEDELPRVQDERVVAVGLDERGQVVLLQCGVDVRVPRVVEDPEEAVEAHVDAGRLHQALVEGLDAEAALGDRSRDVAVGQQHGAESVRAAMRRPRSPIG
jgi:hypothetical protein